MNESRTKNTIRNIKSGFIYQMISIFLPFINRTAVLYILGTNFTGLMSLFSSILQVLNITELGFNSAVVYSLYKPISEKNISQINEIVSFLKRVYYVVGTTILFVGILIMPFIPLLINGEYPNCVNIYIVYLMYLINSVLSYYLYAYKECLLIANQRKDIADNIRSIINIARYSVQLLLLLIFKNFYLYLGVSILGTILTNIMIEFCSRRRYPYYVFTKNKTKISKNIKLQVRGLMINKICDTCRNSFDSVIISSFIGLTALTIYGNYYYIYSALYGIMLVITNSMSASIGNSIVEKSENKNYEDMLTFCQIFSIILGVSTTCLFISYQPFMQLWVGEELLLSSFDMTLFCLYFYVINMNNIRNQYISGTGIWDKLKYSYIIEAIANLSLNLILGKIYGITGVIFATIITIFLFNYFQRNKILFNTYFHNNSKTIFYKEQFYYLFLTILSCITAFIICSFININGFAGLFINGIMSIAISLIIIIIGLSFTNRFVNTKKFLIKIFNKKK